VLTEDKYFKGDLLYLDKVKEAVSLPLLRKDFIVDEYQIYESKVHAADAVLLIAALLEPRRVQRFLQIARTVKLDVLVEVHDEKELLVALDSGAVMIGINTRNLKDLSINLEIVSDLVKKIPKDALIVAESGIKTREDIVFMKKLHVNAMLVGETLMSAPDIKAKTKEFVGYLQ
jgi:indole-3-glycerol phosphate synthase